MFFPHKLFTSLFNLESMRTLEQEQNEAFLDVLVLALLADGQTHDAGLEELGKAAGGLKWKGTGSAKAYLESARYRLEKLIASEPDAMRATVKELAGTLRQAWVREEAYFVAALVTASDEELVENERLFLECLVTEFEIEPKELERMTQKLIRDTSI